MSESDTDSENSEMEVMKEDRDVLNRLDDENFPISDDDEDEDEEASEEGEDEQEEEVAGEDEDEDASGDDEDEGESDQEEDESDEEPDVSGKSAWAESISKILGSKNTGVLSKAQTIEDIEKKKQKKRKITFEVVGVDDGIKVEDSKPDQEVLDKILRKRKRRELREDKIKVFSLRWKPQVTDLDRERTFRKIATRGVVQLFNVVRNQQLEIKEKVEGTKLESKRQEIIRDTSNKSVFLNKLMSGPRAKSAVVDYKVKKEESESSEDEVNPKSNWSALRDDFMTGKKVGWDKESDDEMEQGVNSDDDSE